MTVEVVVSGEALRRLCGRIVQDVVRQADHVRVVVGAVVQDHLWLCDIERAVDERVVHEVRRDAGYVRRHLPPARGLRVRHGRVLERGVARFRQLRLELPALRSCRSWRPRLAGPGGLHAGVVRRSIGAGRSVRVTGEPMQLTSAASCRTHHPRLRLGRLPCAHHRARPSP